MDKMRKVLAVLVIAAIMTVAAAAKITWAEVTETEMNSAEYVQEDLAMKENGSEKMEEAGERNNSFDISDKEVNGVEDVTFDVTEDTKPEISIEEAPAGNVEIGITDDTVIITPEETKDDINVTLESVETTDEKETQITIESQETERVTPEISVTVETEPIKTELPTDAFELSIKEVTNVEIVKFDKETDTNPEITIIPASPSITQEILPPVITETPDDVNEVPKEPEQSEELKVPEKPTIPPVHYDTDSVHHGPSGSRVIWVSERSEIVPDESESSEVPEIIPVPEKTSTDMPNSLPKTGDTSFIYEVICLLSGIAILIMFVLGGRENKLQEDHNSFFSGTIASQQKRCLAYPSGKGMGGTRKYAVMVKKERNPGKHIWKSRPVLSGKKRIGHDRHCRKDNYFRK